MSEGRARVSIHICNPNNCEHDWNGETVKFENGETSTCSKCGMWYENWMMFNLP